MSDLYEINVLRPKYAEQFKCAGPDCPDSCCQRFAVTIDQQTFRMYRKETNPQLAPKFKQMLHRNDKNSEPDQYGVIKIYASNPVCPFQARSGWCEIQQQLGEQALSDVCYSYPRHTYQVAGHFEQYMVLSCPEVAKLIFTAKENPFEFVEQKTQVRKLAAKGLELQDGLSTQQMEDVRIFCIQLAQSPDLSLDEKLVALGWLCNEMDQLVLAGGNDFSALLEQGLTLLEQGVLQGIVPQLPIRLDLQARIFGAILSTKGLADSGLKWRDDVYAAALLGLGADAEGYVDERGLVQAYQAAVHRIVSDESAYQQLQEALSRFLTHQVLDRLFPWGSGTRLGRYRLMLSQLGVVRMIILAYSSQQNAMLSAEEFARLIQVYSRTYQHDSSFAKVMDELLHGGAWGELSTLLDMVKLR